MNVAAAVAEVLKREGVDLLFGYPYNPIIEAAAERDIRTVIVRQERVGVHMADAYSRLHGGDKLGVFVMQHGPGAESAFGGVAQAFAESVPIVVIPAGYSRDVMDVPPHFLASRNFRHVTKSSELVTVPGATVAALRRAFTQARNGRPGPALVEIPLDVFREPAPDAGDYRPTPRLRSAPDPSAVRVAARRLVEAKRPVIYAGQGVHYARAWAALASLAELLAAPVATSLPGKSAFPENHPLALGAGGHALPGPLARMLPAADLIFGVGCSFSSTAFGVRLPPRTPVIHATLDPQDVNKNVVAQEALIGDARLTLEALVHEVGGLLRGERRPAAAVAAEIARHKKAWLAEWEPKRASDEAPLSPYRVLRDLARTVDPATTIITHDAGSPRDQLSPFWEAPAPLSYLGWGKSTHLGYGLGLAMGAKLARPDALCINVLGDAAIGFTGTDIETAVRERIPILTILLNNSSMAMELKVMRTATAKFRSTDISGAYADMARALGAYAERVETPDAIVPAIRRGIQQTAAGRPALLEFITAQEDAISRG